MNPCLCSHFLVTWKVCKALWSLKMPESILLSKLSHWVDHLLNHVLRRMLWTFSISEFIPRSPMPLLSSSHTNPDTEWHLMPPGKPLYSMEHAENFYRLKLNIHLKFQVPLYVCSWNWLLAKPYLLPKVLYFASVSIPISIRELPILQIRIWRVYFWQMVLFKMFEIRPRTERLRAVLTVSHAKLFAICPLKQMFWNYTP